jgi:phosphoglycerate dehydrogenase-like enzyme
MRDPGPILVNASPFGELLAQGLQAAAPGETFVVCASPDELPRSSKVLVTLLDDPDSIRRVLAASVEWAHVLGAGVDGFPFDALGERTLTCSRGAAASAIAEWVLAVMLAFEKSLPDSWVSSPPERWNIAALGGLEGKVLGLIGVGAIGTAIAARALAFDMKVLACRRRPAPAPLSGIEVVSTLAELMARSHHVVVAAPATPSTRHLVGVDALASIKPGAHLVNIARGSLVDHEALRSALEDGRVRRASLDTVEPEPLPEGHWLYEHPSVKLSPHISWSSANTMSRTMQIFVENLARYRRGETLEGVVDPVAGY